ncbi:hypothetical protein [Planotetraspora sp. GP83]|uniref:hypothetical protein n=1 Tax=Planotetraspora sp. GP83 TaxID=3156264 RepID=UPI00351822AB
MAEERLKASAALSKLRAARAATLAAEDELERSVIDARHVNAGWARIAAELGVHQPNATRKYKPLIDTRKWEPRNKWDGVEDKATPALVVVRHAKAGLDKARENELQAVADARTADARWHEIAEIFDMEVSNAMVKFKRLLVEERVVRVRTNRDQEPAEA